jgi:ribosomal-protein-alanine acetyltransferase
VLTEWGGVGQERRVRRLLSADLPAVREILRQTPEASDWSEEVMKSTLDSAGALGLVSERGKEITGCVFGTRVEEEAEILNLAVKVAFRRKGEGSELVRQLMREWERQGAKRIYLEVRESNARAIRFYAGLGFRQAGKRKKYYSGPEEDALVLERDVIPGNPQIGTT